MKTQYIKGLNQLTKLISKRANKKFLQIKEVINGTGVVNPYQYWSIFNS